MQNLPDPKLIIKQLQKGQRLNFKIEMLGNNALPSPMAKQGGSFIHDNEILSYYHLLNDMDEYRGEFGEALPGFEVAGPRKTLHFNPETTTAAIVTCGGLCPGVNNVIRAITFTLNLYGVNNVLGLPFGFQGLVPGYGHNIKVLNSHTVSKIHNFGGTILGTSRGPQNTLEMVEFLVENDIQILFAIGGDGTQRGALEICKEIERRNLNIAVIGIPKTIDNDLNFLEKTFGFETAVEAAREAITRIHTEALSVENGISILKLMGRESGYIAAQASLASMDANICLVPEIPFDLLGENGLFEVITRRLNHKGHCVIVVAEGAGQCHLTPTDQTDASGNTKLGDIGRFLHQKIRDHFQNNPLRPTLRYVDPSYLIRSLPASADDAVFCLRLGQAAVHAGLAGKTSMVTGYWSQVFTHVPMTYTVSSRKNIDPESLFWRSVLDITRQPAVMSLNR
jgi:6-phosphofructokinase 1